MSGILERLGISANRPLPRRIVAALPRIDKDGNVIDVDIDDRSLAKIIAGVQMDIFKTANALGQFAVVMGETDDKGEATGSGQLFVDVETKEILYDAPSKIGQEATPSWISVTMDHDNLLNVLPDQHHDQSHLHDGIDGSGEIDHGDLNGLDDDDHTQYHNTTRAAAWLLTMNPAENMQNLPNNTYLEASNAADDTSYQILGNDDLDVVQVGNVALGVRINGVETRPKYNAVDLALKSDSDTVQTNLDDHEGVVTGNPHSVDSGDVNEWIADYRTTASYALIGSFDPSAFTELRISLFGGGLQYTKIYSQEIVLALRTLGTGTPGNEYTHIGSTTGLGAGVQVYYNSTSSKYDVYLYQVASGACAGTVIKFTSVDDAAIPLTITAFSITTPTGKKVFDSTDHSTYPPTAVFDPAAKANLALHTETAAVPSTTEYPTDGDWGFHKMTVGPVYYLACNFGGAIKKVALT